MTKAAKRAFNFICVIIILVSVVPGSVSAATYEKKNEVTEDYLQTDTMPLKLHSDAAVLMDAKTGEILFSKNARKKEYPASTTKVLTSLVALENNDINDKITYSHDAVFGIEEGSSSAAIDEGEVLTVDQSLYAAMLESANEACNALAEKTAGSIDKFADMMNQKAADLGCVNSHFVNANGLYNKNHYTCANDLALITQDALKNDQWRNYTSTLIYECAPTNKQKEVRYWRNHHSMLNKDFPYHSDIYTVEGGKNGYTVKAKNSLVTYAKSNSSDMELICVVMRCDDYCTHYGKQFACTYEDTDNLLTYGFENFSNISSGVNVSGNKDVDLNYIQEMYSLLQKKSFISFSADDDCEIVASNSYDTSKIKGTMVFDRNSRKDQWGTYQFTSGGKVIASANVYYKLDQNYIKTLYPKSTGVRSLMTRIRDRVNGIKYLFYYIIAAIAVIVVLLIIIHLVRNATLSKIFSRNRHSGYGRVKRRRGPGSRRVRSRKIRTQSSGLGKLKPAGRRYRHRRFGRGRHRF